jgi:hypothetical protein
MNEKQIAGLVKHLDKMRWKSWELNVIKKNHKDYSDKEISEKFLKCKRSPHQVQRKRCEMGIKKTMQVHQVWTPEEVQILKDNYKKYNQKELQEKFFPNKTVEQVRSAKMSRGLHRDPVWTPQELETLMKYGPTMRRKDLQALHLPNKTVDQISWTKKYYGIKAYQVHRKKLDK